MGAIMITVLVVAGNMREFHNFLDSLLPLVEGDFDGPRSWRSTSVTLNATHYIYMSSPEKFAGYQDCQVVFTGSWLNRADAAEMQERAWLVSSGFRLSPKPPLLP